MNWYFFSRSSSGIAKFIKFLAKFNVKRIVMEATGGYEKLVVRELAKINLPVIVVNARHIKSFARALGRLAKTDKLDCQMIAEFGKKIEPELRTIRSDKEYFRRLKNNGKPGMVKSGKTWQDFYRKA